MLALAIVLSHLATPHASPSHRRSLSHDDPKWEPVNIGYSAAAVYQGYEQYSAIEQDVDSFTVAVASDYQLAANYFANSSVSCVEE